MKADELDIRRALEGGILTEYEASLIRRIDLEGKGVTQVAGEDNKSKGTVSLQHSTAVKKLTAFLEEERRSRAGGELAAEVFKLLDQGKGLSFIVTKLKADPDEVMDLYKRWVKMKSEDLNSPGVPGLLRELSSKISKIEEMVKAGDAGKDDGLVTYEGLGESLEIYLSDPLTRLEKLESTRIFDFYNDFKCSNCGATHLVAVKVQCTQCKTETFWGYFPKKE